MPRDDQTMAQASQPHEALLPDLLDLTARACTVLDDYLSRAKDALSSRVVRNGRADPARLDAEQTAAHGLAWLATYGQALREMQGWAERLSEDGRFGEVERLLHQIAFGEYLAQIRGGLPMNQGETVRPQDLRLRPDDLGGDAVAILCERGNGQAARGRLATLLREASGRATLETTGLDDDLEMIRDQFRRWTLDRVAPHAHGWHLRDELIPMGIIEEMAELGVFGLTIPEAHGGLGMPKAAMCVVSEELSRGYIGVGSLGTRSEIAAELILAGGTEAQKARWLPLLASGEVLPTAVFTEPNTGSDLGALRTRAVKRGEGWGDHRQQDLDHPRRADANDDAARSDRPVLGRSQGPVNVPRREGARHRNRAVPHRGHERRRDRGSGIPRHEGVRVGLRRLFASRTRTCWAARPAKAFGS